MTRGATSGAPPVQRLDAPRRSAASVNDEGAVDRAVHAALAAARGRALLAVSGGLDSMVLLDATARVALGAIAAVATFDHGTGPSATRAADAVARAADLLGVPVVRGRAGVAGRDEADWREQRWRFLRGAARAAGASVVATAHTADDQVETVFMRALRGAGARGLAALAAPSRDVIRPLLGVRRADVARYAARAGVVHVEDPSNASRRHLRNRARLDLLPALERVRPGFAAELLALGARAAAWRRDVDALAADLVARGEVALEGGPGAGEAELRTPADLLAELDAVSLAVLWPALAALAGLALDRRGTRRLAAFTTTGRRGGAIQLSGGMEVVRRRDEFVLRRRRGHTSSGRETRPERSEVPLPTAAHAPAVTLGVWRFVAVAHPPGEATDATVGSEWSFWLPVGAHATARPWRAGDRMRSPASGAARRVKRFLADAGVAGVDRAAWPVVVVGDEIVWIPGVRRAHAAPARSARPGVWLTCRTAREPTLR